jgi:integrase
VNQGQFPHGTKYHGWYSSEIPVLTITHAWIKLIKRFGLRGVRLHDCRHTHASLMLKQEIHLKVVSDRLGYASIQITLETYSHIVPRIQQAAARSFDELLMKK